MQFSSLCVVPRCTRTTDLLPIAGIDFVGTIPAEVQYITVYGAAVVAGSKEIEASKRLIAFLASEGASSAIEKSGWSRRNRGNTADAQVGSVPGQRSQRLKSGIPAS